MQVLAPTSSLRPTLPLISARPDAAGFTRARSIWALVFILALSLLLLSTAVSDVHAQEPEVTPPESPEPAREDTDQDAQSADPDLQDSEAPPDEPTDDAQEDAPTTDQIQPSATLIVDGRQYRLPVTLSSVGPLFALEPLASSLGGDFRRGAYNQGYALTLRGTTMNFGPDSQAITRGGAILPLSQKPIRHVNGLMVPLDFLRLTYGAQMGYRFQWDPGSWTLSAAAHRAQDVRVDATLLHLSGVSTLSLRFQSEGQPSAVRYRVQERFGEVRISLLDDKIATASRPPEDAPLINSVRFSQDEIVISLQTDVVATRQPPTSGTQAQLVFEFERGRVTEPEPIEPEPALERRQRSDGINRIVIDPGHGGTESGAVGPSGVNEKDLTLTLARELAQQLRRRMNVKVLLTRDSDELVAREARTAFANFQKADLFISLHLNSSYGRGAHGAETYILSEEASDAQAAAAAASENSSNGSSSNDARMDDLQLILWDMAQSYHLGESQRLANFIQQELNDAMGLRDRGVKQAPFRVLMGAAMPAVLVELGFISNPKEEARLQDPEYQSQLAEALTRAVMRYRAQVTGAEEP